MFKNCVRKKRVLCTTRSLVTGNGVTDLVVYLYCKLRGKSKDFSVKSADFGFIFCCFGNHVDVGMWTLLSRVGGTISDVCKYIK